MRKCCSVLLCVLLLSGLVSCAAAQTVSCPEARLAFEVPETWISVPLTGQDDPDLCLLLEGPDVSLAVYAADAGGLLPDAFEVLTGDETESSVLTVSGVEITCVAGKNEDGEYRIYTWLDRRTQVQFWFLATGRSKDARKVIDGIMDSLVFE